MATPDAEGFVAPRCETCAGALACAPGGRALRCLHCRTDRPLPNTHTTVGPRPLDEGLSGASPTGYQLPVQTLRCHGCGAETVHHGHLERLCCPFCDSEQVHPPAGGAELIRPACLVPFAFDRAEASARMVAWLRERGTLPDDLFDRWQVESVRGIYVPCWIFDLEAEGAWKASVGTRVTPLDAEDDRKAVVQLLTSSGVVVTDQSGRYRGLVRDELVNASGGLPEAELKAAEPFELAGLVDFRPEHLLGWEAERYRRGLAEAWRLAEPGLHARAKRQCGASLPGDGFIDLETDFTYTHAAFRHALLPVWVASYRYGEATYRVVVNGQTGRVGGGHPRDAVKVVRSWVDMAGTLLLFFLWLAGPLILAALAWIYLL